MNPRTLILPVLLTAAALPLAAACAQGPAVPGLTIEECDLPGVQGKARCGTLEVWENRETKSGRKIPIRFVVIPATGPNRAPDAITYLVGGPGSAATDAAGGAAWQYASLRETRDIVLVDQRGTGQSNFIACHLYGPRSDLNSYGGAFYPAEKVGACADSLAAHADLTRYTSDPAADDLDEVRAALGYEQLDLHGGSYGTRAALVYMRRYPERARTAVLQGTVPTGMRMPLTTARDAQRAAEGVFSECEAEAACRAAFPDLRGSLRRAVERLEAGPVEVEVPHPDTGEPTRFRLSRDLFGEGVRYMLYGSGQAAFLPVVVHQAAAGDYGPIAAYALWARRDVVDPGSHGVYLAITCAEDVAWYDGAEGERLAAGTFLGGYRVRDQKAACARWPTARVDRAFLEPVRSEVPTLLVSGEWDPVTPPANAEEAMRTLPRSRHVVIPSAGHWLGGLVGGQPCVNRVIADFIRTADPAGLDAACVDSIRRRPFPTRSLPTRTVRLSDAELARFAGRYQGAQQGARVTVSAENGRVAVQWENGPRQVFLPVGPETFMAMSNPLTYLAFTTEGGAVKGLELQNPFWTVAMERVP
jgi:pimeloyl-ACP methyl ester carboxylesterase